MKRFFAGAMGALMGVILAIGVHCSFMIVEMDSSVMLPAIEPKQKVLVWRLMGDRYEVGDIVAFQQPYFTIDGEKNITVRRIESIEDGRYVLDCDAELAMEERLTVDAGSLMGKAILY